MRQNDALPATSGGDPPASGSGDRVLAWLSQGAMASVLMVMPLVMGGRHVWGRLLFLTLVTIGLLAETLRRGEQATRRRGVPWLPVWMFGAAVLLGALQITALPASWIAHCTPALHSWFAEAMTHQWQPHASWRTISLSPSDSRYALTLLVGYLGWSWLVIRHLERGLRPRLLVGWAGCAAAGLAVLGLLQFAFNNGRFLWWYDHPSRTTWYVVKGPFANENHFAHAMLVGGWALAWWLWSGANLQLIGRRRSHARQPNINWWRPAVGWAVVTLIVVSIVLARSRAGLALMILTMLGSLVAVVRRWRIGEVLQMGRVLSNLRQTRRWATWILMGVAISSLGMAHRSQTNGDEGLRWSELLGDARWSLWQADWELLPNASWLGTGGGTQRYLYLRSFRGPLDVEFVYSENGYLQIALEYGFAGVVVLCCGLAMAIAPTKQMARGETRLEASRCARTARRGWNPRFLAAMIGSVVLLHGAVDFVWWIPACLAPAIAVWLAASSWECDPCGDIGARSQAKWIGPYGRRTMSAIMVALGGWAITQLLPVAAAAPAWERYLRYERDATPAELASEESLSRRIGLLEQVLQENPEHARASAWLAELVLARFDHRRSQRANTMSLADLRRAATGARFATRNEVIAWLRKAVGEDTALLLRAEALCDRALGRQLVEWRLYRVAAQLSFLRPEQRGRGEWLWQRAEQFAPRDPELLYLMGEEALARGDAERAWQYWRRASVESTEMTLMLQRTILPKIGVDGYIRAMRPSTEQVRRLYRVCRRERPQEAGVASRWLVAYVKRDLERQRAVDDRLLADAVDAARLTGAWDDVRWLVEYRIERDPTDVAARRKLAEAEIRLGHGAAARRTIQWLERFGADRQASQRLWEQWKTMRPSAGAQVVDGSIRAGVDRDGE